MPTFGERLKSLRIEKDLTQEQLADYFGMKKSRISQYELNKRQADDELKKQFADYFNVTLDYLLGRSDIRNSENNDTLTTKEIKDIETVIEDLREKLLNTKDLRLDGNPATEEDIENVLDSVRVGIEIAKLKKRRSE